jgi:hypothetical protein
VLCNASANITPLKTTQNALAKTERREGRHIGVYEATFVKALVGSRLAGRVHDRIGGRRKGVGFIASQT